MLLNSLSIMVRMSTRWLLIKILLHYSSSHFSHCIIKISFYLCFSLFVYMLVLFIFIIAFWNSLSIHIFRCLVIFSINYYSPTFYCVRFIYVLRFALFILQLCITQLMLLDSWLGMVQMSTWFVTKFSSIYYYSSLNGVNFCLMNSPYQ